MRQRTAPVETRTLQIEPNNLHTATQEPAGPEGQANRANHGAL